MSPRSTSMIIATALLFVGAAFNSSAVTIHVGGGGEYSSIAEGISAASAGDTVLVADGTYTGPNNRELDFGGLNIVLLAESGPLSTIIDCEGLARGIHLHTGEDSTAIVEGFTITRAFGGSSGGGIRTREASPKIVNCILADNEASTSGGGIYIGRTSNTAIVSDCIFYGNTAEFRGGGVACDHSTVRISNCLFYENTVTTSSGEVFYGGGGLHGNSSAATVFNCTFAKNAASTGPGGVYSYGSTDTLEESIVAFSTEGPGIAGVTADRCIIFGNAGGDNTADSPSGRENLQLDPLFCGMAIDNFTLCANSPCLPGSPENPWGELIGARGQGCGDCLSVLRTGSWGTVKALYR